MQNLVLLPGNSSYNKKLLNDFKTYYSNKGYNVIVFPWKHWEEGGSIDFDYETERVIKKLNKLDKYIIAAKSIGIYVFKQIFERIDKQKMEKVVLMGLPLRKIDNETRQEFSILKDIEDKVHIIQQKDDKYASFEKIENFIRNELKNQKIKLHQISGSDHEYKQKDIAQLDII